MKKRRLLLTLLFGTVLMIVQAKGGQWAELVQWQRSEWMKATQWAS